MITQKQIDARDVYIKELESIIRNCFHNTAGYILREYTRNKSAIAVKFRIEKVEVSE